MKHASVGLASLGLAFLFASASFAQSDAPNAPSASQSLSAFIYPQGRPVLTVTDGAGGWVHIMPPPRTAKLLPTPKVGVPALSYHGGPIMPRILIYNIYWVGKLQTGGTASLSTTYKNMTTSLAANYVGHTLSSNNTQYNQVSPTQFVTGLTDQKSNFSYGGSYTDTAPFPTSRCTDSVTPGNCITDGQIQIEIKKVMALKGWTGGMDKIFLVYTGQGEGSCMGASCAYTSYCAYHGHFTLAGTPVIYGNEPYADPTYCSTGLTPPNGDVASDMAANVASHEVTEAITDPLLNAWWDPANGDEIGDECAWNFGTNTYDGGLANQHWNNTYFLLQQEYSNHVAGCVQVGP